MSSKFAMEEEKNGELYVRSLMLLFISLNTTIHMIVPNFNELRSDDLRVCTDKNDSKETLSSKNMSNIV